MRRIIIRTLIRFLPPMLCIFIAMIAFEEGVNTSNFDIPDDATAMHFYYSLGLFTLAGIDLGMPVDGPTNWRLGLWMVYFLAPLLSVAVVIDGFVATFRPYVSWLWPRKNHLIVTGAGRVTRAFIRELRVEHPRVPVVVVERNPDAEMLIAIKRIPGVWVYIGDIYDEELLDRLHFFRARGILLLTGDEVANVDAATDIHDRFSKRGDSLPPMRIRMADLQLMAFANQQFGRNNIMPCINIHQDAAVRICRETLQHVHETSGMDILIFVGFGRFSQTYLLDFMNNKGGDEINEIRILDPRAGLCWAEFLDNLSFEISLELENIPCVLVEGGVRDPRDFSKLLDGINETSNSVVLLGTSNDQMNLRSGMRFRTKLPNAHILVRLFDNHNFALQMAKVHDLKLISTSVEMQKSMKEWINEMLG